MSEPTEVTPKESMSSPHQDAPAKKRKPLLQMGALGLSVFFHTLLLFMVGGVVLISNVLPRQPFTGEAVPSDAIVDELQPETDPQDSPSDVPSPDETPAPASSSPDTSVAPDVIATDSLLPNQSFVLPATAAGATLGAQTSGSVNGSGTGGGSKAAKTVTPFGSDVGPGLTGYLYDLKQTRDHKDFDFGAEALKTIGDSAKGMDHRAVQSLVYSGIVREFLKTLDPKSLKEFFRAKNPLYVAQIQIPTMEATAAPKAFEVEKEVQPSLWFIHYHGVVTVPQSGTFRFVGRGDDILIVAFNGQVVFDGSLGPVVQDPQLVNPWFELKKGESKTVDIIIGEVPGGLFEANLRIQSKKESEREGNPSNVVQFGKTDAPPTVKNDSKPFVFEQ